MPVDERYGVAHERNKATDATRYGCWNRDEYTAAYSAPNRFAGTTGHEPIFWTGRVRIPFRMSRECMTAKTGQALTDPWCEGCKWRR